MRTLLVLVFLVSWGQTQAHSLTFRSPGKEERAISLAELIKIVPPVKISIYEPHEKQTVEYSVVPVAVLFESMFPGGWKQADEVLFTCEDGYQPSMPVSKFLQYSAYLAFARSKSAFTLTNKLKGGERIKLGPYYLIWDNVNHPNLKAEGGADFPYQVVGIELVDFAKKFPGMTPPKTVSPDVSRGFIAFRKHCMACHSINGDGGDKAFELNYPVSITEMLRTAWLRKWILEPTSIRFNSKMPALSPEDPSREKIVDDIIAYLQEMKKHKRAPNREN